MTRDPVSNAVLLKKCKKIHDRVGMIYIVGCILYIFAATFLMILTVAGDVWFLFLDGFVFKGLLMYCGYTGVYKRSDFHALAAPLVALVNLPLPAFVNGTNYMDIFLGGVMEGFGMASIVLTISVILALLTLKANLDYRYLEEQEGFPYFNERVNEQNNAPKEYIPQFQPLSPEKKGDMDDIPEISKDSKMDEI